MAQRERSHNGSCLLELLERPFRLLSGPAARAGAAAPAGVGGTAVLGEPQPCQEAASASSGAGGPEAGVRRDPHR